MKTQIKQTIAKLSALAFVLSLVVGVAPSQAETDAVRTVDINAEVLASLQLVVDSGSVAITVDPDQNEGENANSGGVVTDSTTTTVNTNNEGGYKLQIQLNGTVSTGSAVLDSTTLTTPDTIAAGDFATENTFGFALNVDNATGATAFTASAVDIVGSGLAAATNGDDEVIYYYLNTDYEQAADIYTGTVTYTAVALP